MKKEYKISQMETQAPLGVRNDRVHANVLGTPIRAAPIRATHVYSKQRENAFFGVWDHPAAIAAPLQGRARYTS